MTNINKRSRFDVKMPFEEFGTLDRAKRGDSNGVIFSCLVGYPEAIEAYMGQLNKMLVSLQAAPFLLVNGELKKDFGNAEIENARRIYAQLAEIQKSEGFEEMNNLDFGLTISRHAHRYQIGAGYLQALECYKRAFPDTNESMLQNLGIKLLLWLKHYGSRLFELIQSKEILSKAFFYGTFKKHELCFMHFLWQAGCDVICVNPSKEPLEGVEKSLIEAQILVYQHRATSLPAIDLKSESNRQAETQLVSASMPSSTIINNNHPSRLKPVPVPVTSSAMTARADELAKAHANEQIDYSTEVLSLLSDSVVMIKVHNENGDVVAGGSGVVISQKGYILTNLHVVAGGSRFGVFFENDDKEYMTNQIIKYHQAFDIALIQVDRQVKALHLSPKPLVRGQKVVAIGSPLGLFNTISEGIVSGFRSFEDVDMVQFTAPISSGSSGGALINMQGELVGITTAGFQGQNLNLAVPSEYLKLFAGGFMI